MQPAIRTILAIIIAFPVAIWISIAGNGAAAGFEPAIHGFHCAQWLTAA